ncbi:MAG: hypothetical protein Alpg2KO_10330 [Alphaproteobacteria bacterium]
MTAGRSLNDDIRAAEEAMARLMEDTDFSGVVGGWIAECKAEIKPHLETKTTPIDPRQSIYVRIHQIKGSAANYGHPLLGRLAASMTRLLRPDVPESQPPVVLVEAHLEAMTAALSLPVGSPGLLQIEQITDALEAKVQNHLAEEARKSR